MNMDRNVPAWKAGCARPAIHTCIGLALVVAIAALLGMDRAHADPQQDSPPRTHDGRPDLGGVWTHAADLPIERPDALPPAEGDSRGYLLADPPDGKMPFRDREGALAWRQKYTVYVTGGPMPEFTTGVDVMPNRDRCLMAANAAAPPMTSQGVADAYQIVQTPSVIAINVEMMHETRIIRIFDSQAEAESAHRPAVLQLWTGDSVGWWEGDDLIVETVSVNAKQRMQSPMPMSEDARIIERFRREAGDAISYTAEVTDLVLYASPWSISSRFRPDRRMWEYACHEGNEGVPGILSGARSVERRGR